MKKIAFVFTHAPHGSSGGREGLDAVLATSALTEEIGLFFISDGVFQLLSQQKPETILSRNYIATFGVLALYDINNCFICSESLSARGLDDDVDLVLDAAHLNRQQMQQFLSAYDVILTF